MLLLCFIYFQQISSIFKQALARISDIPKY